MLVNNGQNQEECEDEKHNYIEPHLVVTIFFVVTMSKDLAQKIFSAGLS